MLTYMTAFSMMLFCDDIEEQARDLLGNEFKELLVVPVQQH